MIQPDQKAKAVLDTINYITIATVDSKGQPWNTPVAGFHFANDYTFYWASWLNNLHSKNIREQSKVFVVVYDSTPSNGEPGAGVYMLGKAVELNNELEVMAAALVFKNDPYNPSDGAHYLGDYPRRIYRFTPQQIWMNTDDAVNGNFVDKLTGAEL
jgi:hypothetical protein